MGDVPDKVRHEMTVGARHSFSILERAFRYQKAASKRLYEAYISDLHQDINRLRWSDPGLTELNARVRLDLVKLTLISSVGVSQTLFEWPSIRLCLFDNTEPISK